MHCTSNLISTLCEIGWNHASISLLKFIRLEICKLHRMAPITELKRIWHKMHLTYALPTTTIPNFIHFLYDQPFKILCIGHLGFSHRLPCWISTCLNLFLKLGRLPRKVMDGPIDGWWMLYNSWHASKNKQTKTVCYKIVGIFIQHIEKY